MKCFTKWQHTKMWKCACQICKLRQEIYIPTSPKKKKKSKWKDHQLSFTKRKVKQSKIYSIPLIVRIEKNPFPSLYTPSAIEGFWYLNIVNSDFNWKDNVYLYDFIHTGFFPHINWKALNSHSGIFIFISITE